jgi:2-polyprenyl-3-methyl-5-hydroxy-6-metoxy-1,4-benzoquinol methylase
MNDAVTWHSAIACDFDAKYARSSAFKERLAVWSGLIERFADSHASVLDAGCGSGVFSILAAGRAHSVLGFDASPQMVALAERRRQNDGCTNATFRVAALEDGAVIAGRRFELILCSSVLEYVEDFWRSFDWLAAALKPNGVLAFSMPNGVSLYRKAERIAFRLTERPAYYAHVRHVMSLRQVSDGLAARTFEVAATQYYAATPGLSAIVRPIGRPDLADNLFVVACRRSI